LTYTEKAAFYLERHDYSACANTLRKAIEKRLKALLPPNELYEEIADTQTGLKEIRKVKNLGRLIYIFISYCGRSYIQVSEINEIKNLKDWYLNPFSHDNISTPAYRKELEDALILVKKIDAFKMEVILEAGSELYFQFSKPETSEFREYRIKLIDNIRHIRSEGKDSLTNAKINCSQWTRDTTINQVSWLEKPFLQFYKNKRDAFLGAATTPIDLFAELKLSDGRPLNILRKY
jgi:hypothetical protein